jgi:ankyrin repeat protein
LNCSALFSWGFPFLLLLGCFLGFLNPSFAGAASQPKSDLQGAATKSGDLYALVVGVSKYRDERIPKLDLSDKDARAFGEFLEAQKSIFKETRVTYLLNERATKSEIEKYLYYTLPKAGKNDTIILFISGHGSYDPVRPKESPFLFLPYDAEPDYLGTSSVKMSGLEFLNGIEAERILIVADACHAGGFSGIKPKASIPSLELIIRDIRNSSGRAILTSGRQDQLSWEVPNLSNSVFTHNLLMGLKGKADKDHDGVVTLSEAYEYAYARTKDDTSGHQHPQLESKIEGAFPLSFVGTPMPTQELKKRLFQASGSGDVEKIEQLLAAGADINSRDQANDTPLIVASRNGHKGVVKLLLGNKSIDVDASNHSQFTALTSACEHGHTEIAESLLTAGANANFRTSEGQTALAEACSNGHVETAKLLLARGADIKARTDAGKTPLNLAAAVGQIEIVRLLLKKGADVQAADLDGGTALTEAARRGHAEIVKLLLENKAVIGQEKGSFSDKQLVLAVLQSDLIRVKQLLEIGASADAETDSGDTPLSLAAGLGHLKVLTALIESRANVNCRLRGHLTPLLLAADSGAVPVLQLLLSAGAYAGDKDKGGNTPLAVAATNGHTEAVKLLLARKSDIDARNLAGRTPLMQAAENGHSEAAKVLLAAAVDVNAVDQQGNNALMTSAENGNHEIVRLLLNKELDVNAKNNKGRTALFLAARNGHKSVVKLLLAKGADATIPDWEGKTASTVVAERGLTELAELFKGH